ncbi:MAG: metallophosphoesterase family protein [Verrucomicrobiota bacterium]
MRIVHFSDIHIGRLPDDATALFDKRLLGFLNFLIRRRGSMNEELIRLAVPRVRSLQPDLVVCTGDLTCVGAPVEFEAARAILKPLYGSRAYEFFALPGNHDAYVRNHRCRRAFKDTFAALNGERLLLDSLPQEVRRGQLRLLFVNEAHPRAPWKSTGELSALTRQWLEAQTEPKREPAERRILVGHFPSRDAAGNPLVRRRRLDGDNHIAELLASERLDMALCGHIHTPFRRDVTACAMEVCAGSLPMAGKLNVVDYCPLSGELVQQWENVTGPAAGRVGLAKQLRPAEVAPCP